MYTNVRNVFLPRTIGSQWSTGDLSNTRLIDIYTNYSKAFAELSHPASTTPIYFDIFTFRSLLIDQQLTLNQVLALNGDNTLPTVDALPNAQLKYVRYTDAVQSQFKLHAVKKGFNIADNPPYRLLPDLKITRDNPVTALEDIHKYCLTSVNGFIHMSDTDGTYAYIDDGAKTLEKTRYNQVGLWSFADVGKLTKIKLDPTLIRAGLPNDPLKEKIYFEITQDIGAKAFFLVLGGYIVFPRTDVFWRRGDKSFALNLNFLNYPERILESRKYIDLSSLQLSVDPVVPDVINAVELWSDEVIRRYMMLSQSFLVIVDVDNLNYRHLAVRCHNQSSQFTCYQDPSYPLQVGYGRTAEYWKTFEEGVWSMWVADGYKQNYLINGLKTKDLLNVDNHVSTMKPFYYSSGNLLEIYGFNN